MVRVLGLDCPLDIFRHLNEFPADAFGEVLSRSTRNADGTWLPDSIDLAISKDLTKRDKDLHDINFLESMVRTQWVERLPPLAIAELAAAIWIGVTGMP